MGTGYVNHNTVTGIAYDGTGWVASSILNYYADLDVTNNNVTGAHVGLYNIDGAGSISGNNFSIIKTGGYGYGIIATDPPEAVPAPFGEDAASAGASAASTLKPLAPTASLAVNVSNNIVAFSGSDKSGTYGIEADAGYGLDDLDVTVNDNIVTGFDVGIEFYACEIGCDTGVFTSLVANENCLSGNTLGMRSNASLLTDGTSNWWGHPSGPTNAAVNPLGTGDGISGNIAFSPWLNSCGGTPTGAWWNKTKNTFFATLQDANDDPGTEAGDVITPVNSGQIPGHTVITKGGITIELNGRTFTGGSPFLDVMAPDVTVLGPGVLDGNHVDDAIVIHEDGDNFWLEGVEIKNWESGVHIVGTNIESFKMVSNWVHNQDGAGLVTDTPVNLTGVVTIEGNLFKDNDIGVAHQGVGTLDATYNSWGADSGPYSTTENPTGAGENVSDNVAVNPWTFSEIYFDVDPVTAGDQTERHVFATQIFDVALMGDAENLSGHSFIFSYDTAKLTLNSTSFTFPWTGGTGGNCQPVPDVLPTGQVGYYCALTGGLEWNGGTIVTLNFTAKTTGESFFDIFADDSLSSGAVGGVKIFVNNAGYNLPSAPYRDITDTNDGRILADLANFTGFIDLQGRANDSGALFQVFPTNSGGTLLAQGSSLSSGKYTSAHEAGQQLLLGSTYYLFADRALFLPTYSPFVSKALDSGPLTALANMLLLGGDATDDNAIGILDAGCIGGAYGSITPGICSTANSSSDVNGDGVVNIFDLTLMGGNYGLSSSPWVP